MINHHFFKNDLFLPKPRIIHCKSPISVEKNYFESSSSFKLDDFQLNVSIELARSESLEINEIIDYDDLNLSV
jgi:hypothetical protein